MADKPKNESIANSTIKPIEAIKDFYTSVMQDSNSSIEDRMLAAERLKEIIDEESR